MKSLQAIYYILLIILVEAGTSCKKILDIPLPATSIPQTTVFSTDQEAISALSGAYYSCVNSHVPSILNGAMTIYTGLAADELIIFDQSNPMPTQLYQNNILPNNNILSSNFWMPAYNINYHFNAIIESVQLSNTLSTTLKDQLTGHALFGRSMIHYYLSTVFDAVPFITSTDWRKTSLQKQIPITQLIPLLIADLEQARKLLPKNYDLLKGGRLIANKWAATALLAKLYMFEKDWEKVSKLCDEVINSGQYSLASTPNEVFLLNSPETILQWQQDNTGFNFNATSEGMTLLPINGIFPFPPFAYLSPSLLNRFTSGDARYTDWIKLREINGIPYYYPYKYKIGPSQAEAGAALIEGYMVFRLAEIILMRAEARAMQGFYTTAMDDLNLIRNRAKLSLLPNTLPTEQVLPAIQQERRLELFCEWGNRWTDLKRWGHAHDTLTVNKGFSVTATKLVFPIPINELLTNPNLEQNPGYK